MPRMLANQIEKHLRVTKIGYHNLSVTDCECGKGTYEKRWHEDLKILGFGNFKDEAVVVLEYQHCFAIFNHHVDKSTYETYKILKEHRD